MSTLDAEVVIVGAGPAGLATALELSRHGVESLVLERRAGLSPHSRATAVSTRSMELLRSWGLEQEVRDGAVELEWLGWRSETLASAPAGAPFLTGLPTREQSAVLSPTAPAAAPQDHVEPVLLRRIQALGRSRVEFGGEVTAVVNEPDRVRVTLRDGATGRSRTVRGRYLVGADGIHSAVRAALDIAMPPAQLVEHRVGAVFQAPLWDVVDEHRYCIYSVSHADAAGAFVPAGRGDRWVYAREWHPEREPLTSYTPARMTRLIRLASGAPGLEPRFQRIDSATYAAQLAEAFRHGRAFLAGDAAHRVTPRGATGMNIAIHDGYDLGWKLAWVLRGWAGPGLLDSYEAERRPPAAHNVARSADPNGSVREIGAELHVDLGGRIPHHWTSWQGHRVSTLDLLGPGLTLFTGPQRHRWDAAAAAIGGPLRPVVRDLDAITARAMGLRTGGALLARPDGAPAGSWSRDEEAVPALRAAVRAIVGGAGGRTAFATASGQRVVA